MSGGSWDYAFSRFDDVADRLAGESDPLRRLMAKRVALLTKALHDIEWVDSGDYSDGKEVEAIKAFLNAEFGDQVVNEINAIAVKAKTDIDAIVEFVNSAANGKK
jgi:hypothetical protein